MFFVFLFFINMFVLYCEGLTAVAADPEDDDADHDEDEGGGGGLLGALLEPSWAVFGAVLGLSGGHLGALWPSWRLLGPSWGRVGVLLEPSWAILGRLGAVLGALWGRLGALRGRLGGFLGRQWAVLGRSWGLVGPSWQRRRRKRRVFQNHTKTNRKSMILVSWERSGAPLRPLVALLERLGVSLGAVLEYLGAGAGKRTTATTRREAGTEK